MKNRSSTSSGADLRGIGFIEEAEGLQSPVGHGSLFSEMEE